MTTPTTTNTILFEKYPDFATSSPPTGIIDTDQHLIPDLLRDYEYPVSSWPVIISPAITAELEKLTVELPRLMNRIPSAYFHNDAQQIADFYFEGNESIAEYALLYQSRGVDVGCRLDLTLTSAGFKVLEINIGSSIGGWQVDSFRAVIRKLHPPLYDPATAHHFESRHTQSIYIQFLVDKILEYVSTVDVEINVFVELGETENARVRKNAAIFFNDLLGRELKSRGLTGGAYVGFASELSSNDDDQVLLGDTIIHGVLFFNSDGRTLSSFMLRPFIMDQVYFPDHLGLVLLKNKGNLALLRELAEKDVFTSEENRLILQYIPWTFILEDRDIQFHGQGYRLPVLLRDHKDRFVIKSAVGFQGRDVFVGKFLSPAEWDKVIEQTLSSKAFIVQEFSDSLDFLAPDKDNEWGPHKLIWGAFGFGDRYGGVWVRMSAVKTSKGVINSATGAMEAIVFEHRP